MAQNIFPNKPEVARVTRTKQEAKASYDRLSRWYDVLAGRFEGKYRGVGLQMLGAREGEKVLEIGFGTGHCILALAQSVGSSGKVYGIDISEGMFNITQSRVREAGLAERVELKCGDAAKLPFEAGTFDAVFVSFTLELFDTPEIPVVLNECQRILRSGGRISIVAMSKRGKDTLSMRLYEWAHRKFPKFFDCRPILVQKALEGAGFLICDAIEMSMLGLSGEAVLAERA
jgi:demethylmenaquinone methyltransferase/2-methoxy-6-polyprenyl-1,4-benzoquinol methylase